MKCNQFMDSITSASIDTMAVIDSVSISMPEIFQNKQTWYLLGSVAQMVGYFAIAHRFRKVLRSTRTIEQELEFGDYNEKIDITDKASQRICTVNTFSMQERWKKLVKTSNMFFIKFAAVSSALLIYQLANGLAATYILHKEDDTDIAGLLTSLLTVVTVHNAVGNISFITSVIACRYGKKWAVAGLAYIAVLVVGWTSFTMIFTSAVKISIGCLMQAALCYRWGQLNLFLEAEQRRNVASPADHPLRALCEEADGFNLVTVTESPSYMEFAYAYQKKKGFFRPNSPVFVVYVDKNQHGHHMQSSVFLAFGSRNDTTKLMTDAASQITSTEDGKLLATEPVSLEDIAATVGRYTLQAQFSI